MSRCYIEFNKSDMLEDEQSSHVVSFSGAKVTLNWRENWNHMANSLTNLDKILNNLTMKE